MATNPVPQQPQQPADYERFYLSKLEGECQQEYQQLQTYMSQHAHGLSPQEIVAIINHLHAWEQYFLQYEPWSQYLSKSGLPRLSARLSQMRSDLQGAVQIYSQMYQSAVKNQADIAKMQADASRQYTETLMEMNARTQAVYNRCNEMYRLVSNGYPVDVADVMSRIPR
jgi:hypothetical protein